MVFKSKVNITDGGGDFDFLPLSREAYKIGTDEESQEIAYDASQMISDFRNTVSNYRNKFETDFNEYTMANSVMRKMKNSLTVSEDIGSRSSHIAITLKQVNNNKRATTNFIKTMQLGHSLLLQMRETLTGQNIKTKFMIEYEGKIYQVYEDDIQDYIQLTLSRFGGQTVSNPFSLAYQIDAEVLAAQGILNEQNLIENAVESINLYQTILDLKPEYLKRKSEITGREYPNIFWDSKDGEILEQLQQEATLEGYCSIDIDRYESLRKLLGGGGGYATPFYKLGDIGSVQVKFFKFKNNGNVANVNFARFSLLRDRFKQLDELLSDPTKRESDIMEGLQSFFTEKEALISSEISQRLNQEAKESFKQWLTKT
jgi:hypothetical protein